MHVLVLNPTEGQSIKAPSEFPEILEVFAQLPFHQRRLPRFIRGSQDLTDSNSHYHLGPLQGHFRRHGLLEAAALANQRLECTRGQFE